LTPPSPSPPPIATLSLPKIWFSNPLKKALKKLVRPAVSHSRRKELTIKMGIPREVFEDLMAPIKEGEIKSLARNAETGMLLPTRKTGKLLHFEYTVGKGSVTDRLFNFEALEDQPPKPKKQRTATEVEVLQAGEEDAYEVESIISKRTMGKRTQYLIKWAGWDSSTNTWEGASRIHPDLVAAYEGRAVPPARLPRARLSAPAQFKRGAGCARARLSVAAQKRGGVPQTISMVCGNVLIRFSESVGSERMPTIAITFYVLSMDKKGHIIWPTNFALATQATLRMQVCYDP
jgi:hypothetical protein